MIFTRHTIPNALRAGARLIRTLFSRDPIAATPEVQYLRELRCVSCPQYREGQCKLCTCVVALKTSLAPERCPIGEWHEQTRFSTGL